MKKPVLKQDEINNLSSESQEQLRLVGKLQETTTFLSAIVENIPNMIFLKEAESLRFEMFNDAGEKLLGMNRNDLIGKCDYDFFPKEQADFFVKKDREVLSSSEIVDIPEEEIATKNGKRILHTKKMTITVPGGKKYLLGISEDVTDRKRAERLSAEKAQESQNFQKALDQSSIVVITGPNGIKHHVNDEFCKLSGYTREEIVGTNFEIHDGNFHGPNFKANIKKLVEQGNTWKGEIRCIGKNKSVFWIAATVVSYPGDPNSPIQVILIGTDITKQKRAQEKQELRIRKDLTDFKYALDRSSIVAITDAKGMITYVNDKFCDISQYSREELIGRDHRIINSGHHPRDFFKNLWNTISAGDVWSGEIQNRAKDGTHYWLATVIVPFLDSSGKPFQYVAIRTDVTASKEAEKEFAQIEIREKAAMEASRLKSEFLANMSHEIRTPLNGIIGMTGLLLDSTLDSKQIDYLASIRSSAEGLATIVDDVLDLSKIESGKLEVEETNFDFRSLLIGIEKIFKPSVDKKGLKLEFKLDDRIPTWLVGDAVRMRQVLINLIGNAVKFTALGSVLVQVQMESLNDHEATLRIAVEDTGIGIPKKSVPKLFEAFTQADSSTTRKFGGTGLGLSISKRLVELMKGTIGVSSVEGVGSKFWFQIALKPGVAETKTHEDSPRANALTGIRVLIAEDNIVNQKVIQDILKTLGAQTTAVVNGKEVLSALQKSEFDIVLMDCQMPEMDGFEATAKIRNSNSPFKEIPIVALTANVVSGVKDKCLRAGMNDYISKPFSVSRLIASISGHVSKIDLSVFDKFKSVSFGDNFLSDLAAIYFLDAPKHIEKIKEAFNSRDLEKLGASAHSLKSSSRNMGAMEVGEICERLENLTHFSDTEVSALIKKLEQKFAATRRALAKLEKKSQAA